MLQPPGGAGGAEGVDLLDLQTGEAGKLGNWEAVYDQLEGVPDTVVAAEVDGRDGEVAQAWAAHRHDSQHLDTVVTPAQR